MDNQYQDDDLSNSVTIHFKEQSIQLNFEQFADAIDIDELVRIDYSNLYAELLTISVLMNKVGILKAEAENSEGFARLDRDIEIARKGEHYRKSLVKIGEYANGKDKTMYPTKDEVDNAVTLDPEVQALRRKRLRKAKESAYLDSLYWAVKSKEKKLDRIGEKMNLAPEEFEKNIQEGAWNSILIKASKKLIK
jgi:hypothetical protein